MLRLCGLLAMLAALGLSSRAAAQLDLSGADSTFDAGDPAAVDLYRAVLEAGGQTPAVLTHVHRRLGILHSLLGDNEAALTHFQITLAIDPTQTLPDQIGPREQMVFRAVQEGRRDRPLVIEASHQANNLLILVENDQDSIIVELEAGGGGWTAQIPVVDGQAQVAAPEVTDPIEVVIEGHDMHGNLVVSTTLEVRASQALTPTLTIETPAESDPLELEVATVPPPEGSNRWKVWVSVLSSVAAVGLGLGLGFGLRADSTHGQPIVRWD